MGSVCESLISEFQELHEEPPEWAWGFNPSIPLIGQQYKCGSGVLVYASAENFDWIESNASGEKDESMAPERFHGDQSWNRYREQFESKEREYEDKEHLLKPFFPDVGIQPVTDGGLLAAGLYASLCLGRETRDDPREFLEVISLSNMCKFTIRDGSNSDYIKVVHRVRCSFPFLKAELEHLRPHVALIPHKAWDRVTIKKVLREASPETRFLPVPQFNELNVKSYLKEYEARAKRLRRQWESTPLGQWMGKLKGGCVGNGWRYLARMEEDHF
jgi:hypothetical protein